MWAYSLESLSISVLRRTSSPAIVPMFRSGVCKSCETAYANCCSSSLRWDSCLLASSSCALAAASLAFVLWSTCTIALIATPNTANSTKLDWERVLWNRPDTSPLTSLLAPECGNAPCQTWPRQRLDDELPGAIYTGSNPMTVCAHELNPLVAT